MESDPEEDDAGPFNEACDRTGNPRLGYAELFGALEQTDLEELRTAVDDALERMSCGFAEEPFVVDPIPRLIGDEEWAHLATGLAQRTRALNHFLLDAYGEQRVVREGIIDGETILAAQGYEPDLLGCLPQHEWPAAIAGFDVVRAADGEFLVLEDNLRTPSGFSYALAARRALTELLPPGCPEPRAMEPYELLAGTLRAASPAEDASMIVLTDGPSNVAYYEHREAAQALDAPLVTPDDLIADGQELRVRVPGGRERKVDVVYRRTDEDRVRNSRGGLTEVARLLLPSWLSGRIGLVNAFGNGLADDKLIHGHVEDFIRLFLGEEPVIRSVPTVTMQTEEELLEVIDRLHELVVKPRHGHGGKGVTIGTLATPEELEDLAEQLESQPERFISQPIVPLSLHPTVIDGELELRHVDLRAFAFAGEDVTLLAGGLTRVALEEGELVVNSSQNGGGKDTWILG